MVFSDTRIADAPQGARGSLGVGGEQRASIPEASSTSRCASFASPAGVSHAGEREPRGGALREAAPAPWASTTAAAPSPTAASISPRRSAISLAARCATGIAYELIGPR